MEQGAPGDTRLSFTADVRGAPPGSGGGIVSSRASLALWLPLVRPAMLPVAVAPVSAALALLWARGVPIAPVPALSVLFAAIFVSAGASMLDAYHDHERFATLRHAPVLRGPEPPSSPLDEAGIRPLDAQRVGVALLGLGALCGVPAALAGGWLTLLLGLAGVAAAFLYAATPYALKRFPGGELIVALALGPGLVYAAVLSQRQRLTPADALLGLALGCFVLALIMVSHLRVAAARREWGRKTLVTFLGDRGGRALCVAALLAAYVFVVLVAVQPRFAHGALAALLSLPAALVPLTGVLRAQAPAAIRILAGQTLRAYVVFSAWLVAGFLLAGAAVRLYPPVYTFLFG
jgi:1,4-dihydroxy-2-naphthoate octaprenyltransferase